jgi:AraC-like DNA-binding protein
VFIFEFTYPDYQLLIEAMAKKMQANLKDGWLFIPKEYADGYIRYLKLPNGIQVNIIKCTANTNWYFRRIKSDDVYYTLRFDKITIPGEFKIGVGDDVLERKNEILAIAYLTSSVNDWFYHVAPGTSIKGLNILISKEELGRQLGIDMMDKILPAYIALRNKSVTMEPLDSFYNQLLNEIMDEHPDTPYPEFHVMNRVQLLIERFFRKIKDRVEIADVTTDFKPEDIQTIVEIEKQMLADLSGKPPSINDLSRKAAMSATKFKNLFKAVFGTPVYEYYQQHRMQKAAELMRFQNVSIKEAGVNVGYTNISNFNAAFIKQFNLTPQEYIQTASN